MERFYTECTPSCLFISSLSAFFILIDTELPRGAKRSGEDLLGGIREYDVGSAGFPPSAVNREKHIRLVGDEIGLKFRGEHQVSIAFGLMGQRGEDSVGDTEIRVAHVRGFVRSRQR
jgi:hypothetical protein